MNNRLTAKLPINIGRSIFLLIVLVLVVYGNTLNASWHLDDRTNILDNKNVHVTSLSFDDWSKSVLPPFNDPGKATSGLSGLYRPVAMLTFAINWFLGGADVFGYHLVNIGLHCVTSILLFFTCLHILNTPLINGRYQENDCFIAFLATALWALHPIQTQAVTYVVQRMAVLADLFYLAGICLYLEGRNSNSFKKRALFFGMGILSYMLALGSKQNAITLPAACLLVEIVFFQPHGFWNQGRVRWIGIGIVTGLAAFFVLALFYWQADPISTIMEV